MDAINTDEERRDLIAKAALIQSKHSTLRTMEFHQAFGHPVRITPEVPNFKERKLRVNLIVEEVGELISASGLMNTVVYQLWDAMERYLKNCTESQMLDAPAPDIVEVADALGDIRVVVSGADLVWGIPSEAIDIEIFKSNMSKLGLDGKPLIREDGKILKGPNYFSPRIYAILYPDADIETVEKQYGITAEAPQGDSVFPKNPQSAQPPSE